ncbi:hypothetical protein RHGRI_009990 [Rhododendron griersonianum]|uniref:Reverse transcriptase zinc-binding domain-containing protein n=1 Tax=Rhododendron griersonianum TaxID=479676 RepID=A0AAV6KGU5_9ERIC|nr:hypothetical protein RHGRI_009990 [Rhododendron griersonianum]
MVDERNQDNWDFHFTRLLRDMEKEQLLILVQLLSVVQLQDDQEDCIQWKWSRNLNFSVKSAYSKWEEQEFSEEKELFAIWKNICPPKVELFAWMAVQECISARSVFVRRGILNSELGYCPVCNTEEETPNHLLLLCNGARRVWNDMMAWWHIAWVCPPTLKTLFLYWDDSAFKNFEKVCWQATFYAAVWTIWLCRNDAVFKNKAWEVEEVVDLVKTRVALWIKGKFNLHEYSVEDFKWNLDGIRKLNM